MSQALVVITWGEGYSSFLGRYVVFMAVKIILEQGRLQQKVHIIMASIILLAMPNLASVTSTFPGVGRENVFP